MFRSAVLAPNAPRRAPKARLGLEQFESREVPAALTWTNAFGNNSFYTASNWVYTGTNTTAQNAPMMGDDVTFDGDVSSANCTDLGLLVAPTTPGGEIIDPEGPGGTVIITPGPSVYPGLNSLSIIDNYAGTVSVIAALQVGTFTLSAAPTGAIAQPYVWSGNAITVTNTFTWTRGILNSALNGANVFLAGATAAVNPGVSGSLTSGSSLILNSRDGVGAVLALLPGEVVLAAGIGIEANDLCQINIKPELNAKVTTSGIKLDHVAKSITMKAGSELTVTPPPDVELGLSGADWNGYGLSLVNDGGHATFHAGTNSMFGSPDAEDQDKALITQSAGIFEIYNDASVSVAGELTSMNMSGGKILINNSRQSQIAGYLGANLKFSGGQIAFTGYLGFFLVGGNVLWTGGVFSPRLDAAQNGTCDLWRIDGSKLQIPNPADVTVQPATINWNPVTGIAADWRWEPLKFRSVELPQNGTPPSVGTVPGNAPMQWFISTQAGQAIWKLGAKVS